MGQTPSKVGIFRNGFEWILDGNGDFQTVAPPDALFYFGGIPGDIPITGDWTGSGTTKVGIYRPSSSPAGEFILDLNGNGYMDGGDVSIWLIGAPTAGCVPVTGDWNGSGITKVGLFCNGAWYLDATGYPYSSSNQTSFLTYSFGTTGDIPVVGNWTGSGASKLGILRSGFLWVMDMNANRGADPHSRGRLPGDIAMHPRSAAANFWYATGDVRVSSERRRLSLRQHSLFNRGLF